MNAQEFLEKRRDILEQLLGDFEVYPDADTDTARALGRLESLDEEYAASQQSLKPTTLPQNVIDAWKKFDAISYEYMANEHKEDDFAEARDMFLTHFGDFMEKQS